MAKQQRQHLNERRDDDKHAHANATANKSRKRLKKVSMTYKQRWFPTVPKAISVWASALSSHQAHYVWRGFFDPIGVWDDETLNAADLSVCVCVHTILCVFVGMLAGGGRREGQMSKLHVPWASDPTPQLPCYLSTPLRSCPTTSDVCQEPVQSVGPSTVTDVFGTGPYWC